MRLKVGRRVAIACVTFETVMVTSPIAYIGNVDRVYLLHYVKSPDEEEGNIYYSFFQEVVRQLREEQGIEDIVEVNVEVWLFQKVLKRLVQVLKDETDEGSEVYINISAGSSVYGAAATIASMMMDRVRPFTVGTKVWQVPEEELTIYFDDDRPVGMAREVHDPWQLPCFHIRMPDEGLVRALRVLAVRRSKGHRTSYSAMIDAIKDGGCWDRTEDPAARDPRQAERMYYARHYIDGWLKNGWVVRDERGVLEVTPDGEMVTEVFYP
jgi:hypothetical protein